VLLATGIAVFAPTFCGDFGVGDIVGGADCALWVCETAVGIFRKCESTFVFAPFIFLAVCAWDEVLGMDRTTGMVGKLLGVAFTSAGGVFFCTNFKVSKKGSETGAGGRPLGLELLSIKSAAGLSDLCEFITFYSTRL
jgi:hypothetical protein